MSNTEAPSKPDFYSSVDAFIQQGDIFRVDLVAPLADQNVRLFRSADGRHGSVVFEEGGNGRVFAPDDLKSVLQGNQSLTGLHTSPFEATHDGQLEMVVTFANFVQFFVVVSQTCDVSGVDKEPFPVAMILRAKTLYDICRTDRLPLRGGALETIHEFLLKETSDFALASASVTDYSQTLRNCLLNWAPDTNTLRETRGRIGNFLDKAMKGGSYLYYLADDRERGIPEMCVDFSCAFTVMTQQLLDLQQRRVGRIANPYRDQFAQEFGNRIGRVAVPKPVTAPSFTKAARQ